MEFLDEVILDNTVRSLIIVGLIILFVLALKKAISKWVASLLFKLIHRKYATISRERFCELTIKPLGWLLVVLVTVFALDSLVFPEAWKFDLFHVSTELIAARIGISAVIITVFWFLISFINFIALLIKSAHPDNDRTHGQVIIFFRDLLKVVIGIFGLLLVIRAAFDQDIGTLLTGLSIVGAALALAAKESIENLIASFIIFFDKPFFTGDTVKVNSFSGKVERIGLRSTRIRSDNKTLITVPNKQMVDSIVDNQSLRTSRRAEIKMILSGKTESEKLKAFQADLETYLRGHAGVQDPSVLLTNFSKEGIELTAEFFTQPDPKSTFEATRQDVIFHSVEMMHTHGVDLSSAAGSINIIGAGDAGAAQPNPVI